MVSAVSVRTKVAGALQGVACDPWFACLLPCVLHRQPMPTMWTFVDAKGVKHFASSQLDKRYALLFHGRARAAGRSADQ